MEGLAAEIWATLWQEIGLGPVTPEMFAVLQGGPNGVAYFGAARSVIAHLAAQIVKEPQP